MEMRGQDLDWGKESFHSLSFLWRGKVCRAELHTACWYTASKASLEERATEETAEALEADLDAIPLPRRGVKRERTGKPRVPPQGRLAQYTWQQALEVLAKEAHEVPEITADPEAIPLLKQGVKRERSGELWVGTGSPSMEGSSEPAPRSMLAASTEISVPAAAAVCRQLPTSIVPVGSKVIGAGGSRDRDNTAHSMKHIESCARSPDSQARTSSGQTEREVPKSQAKEATKVAIEVGYRHIDAAFIYQNEVEVGEAIREKIADGTVKREELFYTGKLWSTFHSPELVRPALQKSLKALQLDYIDLYIIHIPMALKAGESIMPVDETGKWLYGDVDLRSTWEALEACKDAGLVKSIGVSNFNRRQLELILNKPGLKYKPVCNQVECHVYLNQGKLLEYCKSKDIVLVAYSVLGSSRDEKWIDPKSPVLLEDPVLLKVGQKYKKSAAQVAMRYHLQRGIVVLAKSFNPERIKQNLEVFNFELTPEDMKTIDGLNKNMRYVELKIYSDHPEYPFADEF